MINRFKQNLVPCLLGVVFCFYAIPFATAGNVIRVPEDHDTIQQGIDHAQSGDIVYVAPGIYYERIHIKSKITVIGAGIDQSIIDGQDGPGPLVMFEGNDIDSDTVLSGFTIKGANAGGGAPAGLGVFCDTYAAPLIIHNKIEYNDFGIYAWNGAHPTVKYNIIQHHRHRGIDVCSEGYSKAIGNFIAYNKKGASCTDGGPHLFSNNIVFQNTEFGIYVSSANKVEIYNNVISQNVDGVIFKKCQIGGYKFSNNIVIDQAPDLVQGVGEGFAVKCDNCSPIIRHNNIWNNTVNSIGCTLHPGNIALDPDFANSDTNFYLSETSPCIDAGETSTRFLDTDGTLNDMGAYGGFYSNAKDTEFMISTNPALNQVTTFDPAQLSFLFSHDTNNSTLSQNIFLRASQGGITINEQQVESDLNFAQLTPSRTFFAGEEVSLSLSNQITLSTNNPTLGKNISFLVKPKTSSGHFIHAHTLNTDSVAEKILAADFNNDQMIDLASLHRTTNTISLWFNQGDNRFSNANNISVGTHPTAMAVGDLDSDGFLDIGVTNQSSNNVSILHNNQDGSFTKTEDINCGDAPIHIAMTDFDNDGHLDIATANAGNNTISFIWGNSTATMGGVSALNLVASPWAMDIGDINRDGAKDLVVSQSNSRIAAWLNNGSGQFFHAIDLSLGSITTNLLLKDFNNDKQSDILYTYSDKIKFSYLDRSVNLVASPNNFDVPEFSAISINDIDGDSDMDICVADQNAILKCYMNNSRGVFTIGPEIQMNGVVSSLYMADIDQDNDLDIISSLDSDNLLDIWLNLDGFFVKSLTPSRNVTNATPTLSLIEAEIQTDIEINTNSLSWNTVQVKASQSGTNIGSASFDPSTQTINRTLFTPFLAGEKVTFTLTNQISTSQDIPLLGHSYEFYTQTRLGSGTFVPKTSFSTLLHNPKQICLSDVNNDHALDIMYYVSNYPRPGYLGVLLNNGLGEFNDAEYYTIGKEPSAIDCHNDIDGDGDLDIVSTGGFGQADVRLITNDGNGRFSMTTVWQATGVLFHDLTTCDIDNDGDADIIAIDGFGSTDNVLVIKNASDGSAESMIKYHAGGLARFGRCADLDNDGQMDIVVANGSNHNVSAFYNQGNGIFQNPINYNMGVEPRQVYLNDMNQDGLIDIISSAFSYTICAVALVHNQGNRQMGAPVLYEVDGFINDVAISDLDGDEDMDWVVISSIVEDGGYMDFFYNNGGEFSLEQRLKLSDYASHIAGGDFDKDGDTDWLIGMTLANQIDLYTDIKSPTLITLPGSLKLTATTNQTNPIEAKLQLNNSGDESLTWTLNCDAIWLQCAPSSGSNSAEITVSVDPAQLNEGTHTASVVIDSEQAINAPLSVDVELQVINSDQGNTPLTTKKKNKGGMCSSSSGSMFVFWIFLVLFLGFRWHRKPQ